MICLGIESSSELASVSIVNEKEKIISEFNLFSKKNHSMYLMPILNACLKESDISFKDISCIAVNKGPGSFTGLRVGLTLAKTLAYVNEIPILGISCFESLREQVKFLNYNICPLIYNKKEEFYATFFNKIGKILISPGIYSIDYFLKKIKKFNEFVLVGDGYFYYKKFFLQNNFLFFDIPKSLILPKSSTIGILGMRYFLNGKTDNVFELYPEYFQSFKADINYIKKHEI